MRLFSPSAVHKKNPQFCINQNNNEDIHFKPISLRSAFVLFGTEYVLNEDDNNITNTLKTILQKYRSPFCCQIP